MSQNDPIERLILLIQDKTERDIRKAKQDVRATSGLSIPIILQAPVGSTDDTVIIEIQATDGTPVWRVFADGRMDVCRVGERCLALWDSEGTFLVDSEGSYLAAL